MQKISKKEFQDAVDELHKATGLPFRRSEPSTLPPEPDTTTTTKKIINKIHHIVRYSTSKSIKILTGIIYNQHDRVVQDIASTYNIPLQDALNLAQLQKAGFPHFSKPEVSIIIPVFNKLNVTIPCLLSLMNHKTKYKFEIVLVDNGSSEPITQCLTTIKNLRVITNKENLGYVGGCNTGAKKAKGNILVFLNNDTLVQDEWLDKLIANLDDPGVGLVGSKLIYPDGVLQEAGGIIFKDASGNNYGKWQDAGDFKYNYRTEVDYVSGASLAIRKQLFDSFGGFDVLYSPAYYEDTDLAFKVRAKGLQVIYEPKSVVMHIEGATAGTDTSSGFKKYQEINKIKFQKRWRKELRTQPKPTDNLFSARTHSSKYSVLFVENSVPEPDKDSGSVREWAILEILKELEAHVTFYPANLVGTLPYVSDLHDKGIEVVYGDNHLLSFESLMQEREGCYDYVIISRPLVAARYLNIAKKYQPTAKIIYDTVDLHYVRTERQAEIEKDKTLLAQAKQWATVENYLIQNSDTTLVVSAFEKNLLENELGYKNIEIVSNIHTQRSLKASPPFSRRGGLMFIGNFQHTPNVDAVLWFCKEIFPVIRKALPEITFNIVGSNATPEIIELDSLEGVSVLGYQKEVESIFDQSRIFTSPLRYGAGVKGKLGQSISLGLPIVTTSVGAEGMHLENNKDCFIVDDASKFAQAVIDLYKNEALWQKFQRNSQSKVEKYLSRSAAKKVLAKIIN